MENRGTAYLIGRRGQVCASMRPSVPVSTQKTRYVPTVMLVIWSFWKQDGWNLLRWARWPGGGVWPPHQQLRRHEAARLCAQRAARKAVGRQSEVRKHRCPRLPSCPRHGVAPQASVASAKGNGTELTLCLSLFSSSCKSASFILAFRSNPCHEGPMAESGLNRRAGGAERQRVVHTGELGGDTPGGHPWALRLGGQDAAGHPGWGSGRAWAGESLGGVSRARHGQGAVQKR